MALSPASLTMLRARTELAEAIRTAARQELDRVAALPCTGPNVSLYQGCQAEYQRRCVNANDLRRELTAAVAS